MDACFGDTGLIHALRSLECEYLTAIASGTEACQTFYSHLQNTIAQAQQLVDAGRASPELAQVLAAVSRPLSAICLAFMNFEKQQLQVGSQQDTAVHDILVRAGFRRRRKRSTRSRKSKAGKCGRVRQSGKKSKRGRKSPVGNPKRRVYTEAAASTSASANGQTSLPSKPTQDNGKRSRTVTAPPTDSMKFGACRDFFLSHLGDPYPTTVQKHQILKQSSPDFTLRSLNLWFVNIRRRSKWMDIFKKHASSKRDVMRDLVARVEAQVAGRPAPNPLPSGAAPPGCKVDQAIVEEVMAMRAVVDMVSREVYGEGWDQILQIKPWSEEEVRAHEERKKSARREARALKADEGKRKQDREARKDQRKRDREQRKRIELEAVHGIRAARELHEKLMAMNKRKRDDNDEGSQASAKRLKDKEALLDENGRPKKPKVRVPKVDENGNPLTKEQRKAIKKAILAAQAQANPRKRKSPEPSDPNHSYPGVLDEVNSFPGDMSPSKRRRRDAVTFDGFPSAEETNDGAGMADLSQLFSIQWASPSAPSVTLPDTDNSPTPVPVPAPTQNSNFGDFAHPSESQDVAMPPPAQIGANATAGPSNEVPRRFSQQLAAYALESGMFDGESFELFTEDTFPGMSVDVNQESTMVSLLQPEVPHHQAASMHVSPVQTEPHTPVPGFAAPLETQTYNSFAPPSHPQNHPPASPYSSASTVTPANGDADSDMSWINAALAQLPSEHDAPHHHHQFPHASGSQDTSGFNNGYAGNQNGFVQPSFGAPAESRAPVSHQRTPLEYPSPQPQPHHPPPPPPQHNMAPPTPSVSPSLPRRPFPQPQGHTSVTPQPSFPHPQPQPQPQSRRAPGGLWQTPYSQPAQQQHQQQYHQPAPSFPAPSPSPRSSFPAPAQPQYDASHERRSAYTHPGSASPQHEYQQHAPIFPRPHSSQYAAPPAPTQAPAPAPAPAPPPAPAADAATILKQHELEFARAQEELQSRFKREQEEQFARFLRAQEELRKQLLPEGNRS